MNNDIIGINIGSKNTVVGAYIKGSFKIILSESSARSIPTVISFGDKDRNYGDIAFNSNRSNFKSTIIYPNRWLGINYNNSLKEEETKYANLSPVKNELDNTLGFKINIKNQKIFYTPEVIMGSFLNKIKNIWLKENIYTDNIVISVPDYYTVYERQAMLDSINISGLNCFSLLNESSAIAIHYAFQKLKELNSRIVCFIDFGHSHLTISYVQFTKKEIKILLVNSERFCGARDLDYLIAEKISYEFQKKHGEDLLDSPKAKISLMNTINKERKKLTVNTEGNISIDEIIKGKDLTYNLSRKNMESIISPILTKFENLCKSSLKQLEKMGIYTKNIHSIEMVGDTLRTPCFLNIIKNIYQKDLSKTLIPDECIAKGCALYAMMNLPNYQIQKFYIKHYNPYYIFLVNNYSETILFQEGDNFPMRKDFIIKNTQNDIRIKFTYGNDIRCIFNDNLIHEYNVHFPNSFNNIELKFQYELNINCIPKLIIFPFQDQNIKINLIKQNFGLTNDILNYYKNEEIGRDENDLIMKDIKSYKNYIEEYIYKLREKINSEGVEKIITQNEKDNLLLEMDKLMNWLYSKDEGLYNINILEEKSKIVKSLGEEFYSRLNGWEQIKQSLKKYESLLYEKLAYINTLEEKVKKGENVGLTLDDINKINEYIQQEFNKYEKKLYEVDVADKSKVSKINVNEVENMINSFINQLELMIKK